jgi:hypothetical protein
VLRLESELDEGAVAGEEGVGEARQGHDATLLLHIDTDLPPPKRQ